jgi:hypothetical protein
VVCLANHADGGVGVQLRCVRTLFGQSGSLRGFKLVPANPRYLVPPQAANASGSSALAGTMRFEDESNVLWK